ncbi:MAG: 2-hydroxyacid dehydrogenase [Xanthobacteraceae bacterium]
MQGALLLAAVGWDQTPWIEKFRALAPDRELRVWPDRIGNPADVAYACVWKPPAGMLSSLSGLKAIFSLGAGVDHLLADPKLPDVPIVRIVDPDLTHRMTEYVVLHTLMIHRQQRLYDAQQRKGVWQEHDQPAARQVAVGIMGLGTLGRDAAELLKRIGFQVAGWACTPKRIDGIDVFHGAAGLDPFLSRTEILIVLLPHTPATHGIVRLDLFRKLKRNGVLGGAYLINAGRGKLHIDADICAALDTGILAGATLDVFPTEPLPADSPLWCNDKVTITPHNASASRPDTLVKNILDQIERFESGLPLNNVIDRAAGY